MTPRYTVTVTLTPRQAVVLEWAADRLAPSIEGTNSTALHGASVRIAAALWEAGWRPEPYRGRKGYRKAG